MLADIAEIAENKKAHRSIPSSQINYMLAEPMEQRELYELAQTQPSRDRGRQSQIAENAEILSDDNPGIALFSNKG